MRKMLVVVVIAGVACVEPAPPQTPVSTGTVGTGTVSAGTVEDIPPPAPTGRLVVVAGQGAGQLSVVERTFGPVIASGTEAGHPWSMRGHIDAQGAATWLQISTGGGGGGGRGALPFQDLGWKKLGHFGSVGSGEHRGIGAPRTRTLTGVVSKQTAAIEVRLADGTSLPAQIVDTGDARASFFVAVWSAPANWEVMIARDAAGAELETYRRSQSQTTATRASSTSTP